MVVGRGSAISDPSLSRPIGLIAVSTVLSFGVKQSRDFCRAPFFDRPVIAVVSWS